MPKFTCSIKTTVYITKEVFEDIELTGTDMVVTQKGVPYPIMVPLFPIITTDNRLDYGSRSKLDN